ncbi:MULTISPECIES: hypothetical protein [Deinococcus]|uniref:HEPN domain-containing protein n=1 Tax=Deinococcus rufus TaxID=2136097 RepID=A0ABV7Z8E5_9DEIO|nr:hypothetical protein [Deinococcus sp. AB2017081]WQE97267.1 hypothetical protein U2P90_18600 [Deinococcus sp. AB2017081]
MEDLRVLTQMRVREAQALLNAGEHSGSYYLLGYALECAIKVCIVKTIPAFTVPDRRLIDKMHTHDLEELLKLAQLWNDLLRHSGTDAQFGLYWAVAKDWNEHSRYKAWSAAQARDLHVAVTDGGSGVLPWIQQRW